MVEQPNQNDQTSELQQTESKIEQLEPEDESPINANLAKLREYPSEYFLNKHTESFICLEQYLCSKSDLKLTLTFFPNLTDPGLDDALNYIPPEEQHNPDGSDKYIKMCKDLNIVPITRVIQSLPTDTLNLKYYGITLKQMRGIADALKINSNVKYLIFQDSFLTPECALLVGDILRESNSLRVLNLKECRIGPEGTEKLCEGISSTQFLHELDLSYNNIGDAGLAILQQSLIENTSIKKLNLGHNNLTEDSGPVLEQLLLENKILEELDLSWNGFFTGPGNKKVFSAMAKSDMITWLNLSWNGISTGIGMRPINKYLRKTKVLRFVDLSWNRLTQRPLKLLKFALNKNKSLEKVKVGNNNFTPDEAYDLASVLTTTKNANFKELDMENMCVNKNFLELKREIKRKRIVVTHGHILCNYEIHGPNIPKVYFERCRFLAMKPKKKKQRKDFGHFILALPNKRTTSEKFLELLKKKKVKKLDKDLLKELLALFPAKKGKIDCAGMKAAYMSLYPDTKLPEETKKKKKGKKRKGKKGKKDKSDSEKQGESTDASEKPDESKDASEKQN